MRSRIYLTELVENTDRRFGSAQEYIPVRVVGANWHISTAMLTNDQIAVGIIRSNENPEDVPPLSWRERLSIAWGALWA